MVMVMVMVAWLQPWEALFSSPVCAGVMLVVAFGFADWSARLSHSLLDIL